MVDFETLKQYLMESVFPDLPEGLTYHNVTHTLDVVAVCDQIAIRENLSQDDACLLKTSALLHDVGFTRSFENHEEEGCRIAIEILKSYDCKDSQIERICSMIMATRIPQRPKNKLEEYLCDADLDYLGRDDFEPIADGLFHELVYRGVVGTKLEWDRIQINFLSNHSYFSEFSKQKREPMKQANLEIIRNRVREVSDY